MGRKTWAALALGVAASAMTAAPAGAATVTVTGRRGARPVVDRRRAHRPRSATWTSDVAVTLAGTERALRRLVSPARSAPRRPATCYSFSAPRDGRLPGQRAVHARGDDLHEHGAPAGARRATYPVHVGARHGDHAAAGDVAHAQAQQQRRPARTRCPAASTRGALSTAARQRARPGGRAGRRDRRRRRPRVRRQRDDRLGAGAVRGRPGTYTIVARRARRRRRASRPWSAPVTVRAFAPFDFRRPRPSPDDRGAATSCAGSCARSAARGSKVRISLARGAKGGSSTRIGKAKIRHGGKITQAASRPRPGKYAL